MAQLVEVKVPDIGDFKDVAVIEVMVKVGDTIAKDQSLVTVESDKASMEIPSSHAGVVKEVKVKVLGHGHSTYSLVHDTAKRGIQKLARFIPGVEFVGFVDRISIDSFCDSEPGVPKRPWPKTREEVDAYREELAMVAESWGADTISPTHQTCLQRWEPFSSERADVRHIISIMAEALGVGHPDRFKAASLLGNTAAIVEQTKPIWSAWGMNEEKASQVARDVFDPAYQTAQDLCECGKNAAGACGHKNMISVDVLKGTTPRRS